MPGNVVFTIGGFWHRLGRKFASLAPVLVGSAVVLALLVLLAFALQPVLPAAWRDILALLADAEWAAARARLGDLLRGAGSGPAAAFVALQAAQVVLAPIPGQVAGLLGGYLFGFWYGLLLSTVGLALGSLLAIGLGRLVGRPLARRFVPTRLLDQFDDLVGRGGLWNFFLLMTLPVFPDDALCFVAGLTRLPVWKLVLVVVLGRLPGLAALSYVGAGAAADLTGTYVVLAVAVLVSFFCWLFSEEIEHLLFRRAGRRTDRRQ